MSEQDNVQSIIKVYEAFGRGDIPYILDQLTDDVRWVTHLDPIVPWSGKYQGKGDVLKFFSAINDSGETTAFTPSEFVAQGDTVVSFGEFGYKAKATGKSDLGAWVFIWKFRDGKISSYEQFHDAAIAGAFR
jgi:ketosteroid isomerase-like protein